MFGYSIFNDKTGNIGIYKRRTVAGVTTWTPVFWLKRRQP